MAKAKPKSGAKRNTQQGSAAAAAPQRQRESELARRAAESAALARALRNSTAKSRGQTHLAGLGPPVTTAGSKKLMKGLARRDQLLEAAITAFAAHGPEGASIRDICTAAGANVAAVKYYFKDKDGLYEAAIHAGAESLLARLPEPNLLAISEPIAALHAWIRWAVEFTVVGGKRRAALTKIILREMREPSPVFERLFLKRAQPLVHALEAIVAQVIDTERSSVDPKRTVACVLVLAMQYEHSGEFLRRMNLHPPRTPQEFDALAGVILDMTMGMIRARKEAPLRTGGRS